MPIEGYDLSPVKIQTLIAPTVPAPPTEALAASAPTPFASRLITARNANGYVTSFSGRDWTRVNSSASTVDGAIADAYSAAVQQSAAQLDKNGMPYAHAVFFNAKDGAYYVSKLWNGSGTGVDGRPFVGEPAFGRQQTGWTGAIDTVQSLNKGQNLLAVVQAGTNGAAPTGTVFSQAMSDFVAK